MKRKWIALVLSVSVLAGTAAVPAFASEMQQEISEMPAVETLQDHTLAETDSVEENCVLVGLKGSYLASADAALERINEIRKEACKQGVQDPRDPNRKLTISDYVPVKWSSDLEYIARVRAAEASVYMDHQRPNGTMCFSQASPNGVKSWGEVLAWNNSNDMITGIDQWYGEKQDWVLSLTQSYFYMNTSQLTILICHCVIYSIFRVNIRNWWIRNPFILPYYRKYLHHNLSYFTMEQKRKNKAEVIAMSIFEYDKEEEERKLRKAEYEAGVESGIAEGKRLAQKEGTIALSRLGLPVEQIAMALQVDVELAKQWIGDK